jgi:hypothetical protein
VDGVALWPNRRAGHNTFDFFHTCHSLKGLLTIEHILRIQTSCLYLKKREKSEK